MARRIRHVIHRIYGNVGFEDYLIKLHTENLDCGPTVNEAKRDYMNARDSSTRWSYKG